MGQFKDITIKEVIEEINVSYFLPDIQRICLVRQGCREENRATI